MRCRRKSDILKIKKGREERDHLEREIEDKLFTVHQK